MIRVVDFEASGPEGDAEILEIGWCDVVDGVVRRPCSVLVQHSRPIDVETMAVHHLQERHFEYAFPLTEIIDGFAAGVNAFCAHSVKFERRLWPDSAAWIPWICTYKCALRLWPEAPRHSNQVLRYFLGLVDLDPALAMPPHRAGPDAYVTARILAEALKLAPAEDLIQWSGQPALLSRVPFGRYTRGMKWAEVDDDFLHWVLARDFDEDVIYTAGHELARRYPPGAGDEPLYFAEDGETPGAEDFDG